MKNLKVLNEKDIKRIICEHFDVAPSKVKIIVTGFDKNSTEVEINVETQNDCEELNEEPEEIQNCSPVAYHNCCKICGELFWTLMPQNCVCQKCKNAYIA